MRSLYVNHTVVVGGLIGHVRILLECHIERSRTGCGTDGQGDAASSCQKSGWSGLRWMSFGGIGLQCAVRLTRAIEVTQFGGATERDPAGRHRRLPIGGEGVVDRTRNRPCVVRYAHASA